MSATERATPADPTEESVPEVFKRLCVDLLERVTADFLNDHGVTVEGRSVETETSRRVDLPMGATISFVGVSTRGTLAISPDEAVAEATHPTGRSAEDDLIDWVGETANQVLGRLKNRLLPYGVELLCDTPITICGQARLGGIKRKAIRLAFQTAEGTLTIWLDVQVDDDIVMHAPDGEHARAEGELVLF